MIIEVKILAPGTPIKTKYGNIEASITAARMTNEGKSYEVSYFWDGEYKRAWLHEFEFTVMQEERQGIGFNK